VSTEKARVFAGARALLIGTGLVVLVAACGGAGSNGASTPPVPSGQSSQDYVSAGQPSSRTQTVILGLAKTVTFGKIASGAAGSIAFPATLAGQGSAAISLQSVQPPHVPAPRSVNSSSPKSLSGAVTPLAFVVVTPSSALAFSATPEFTFTFAAGTQSGYAYAVFFDTGNPQLGWNVVAGPVPASGATVSVPSASHEPALALSAQGSYIFAIVERSTPLATPPPLPGAITEYNIPGRIRDTYIDHITAGPDGNLWFTETDGLTSASIDKFTTNGAITRYNIVQPPYDDPKSITAGPDGNIWFTETDLSKIAKITTSGVLTEYPLPTTGSAPWIITAGPDGNMWFTEPDYALGGGRGAGAIGKITTSGVETDYPLTIPAGQSGSYDPSPLYITAGPDGNLWFTLASSTDKIGIGKITTAGKITMYPLPRKNVLPYGITAGPGGKLWFTESAVGDIASITTSGVVTEYYGGNVPSSLQEIATGSDGNLYVTDLTSEILKMTPKGELTSYPTPTQPSAPSGIAMDPKDGSIWFTESGVAQIGKLYIARKAHESTSAQRRPMSLLPGALTGISK
jgi:streptogramin lyase